MSLKFSSCRAYIFSLSHAIKIKDNYASDPNHYPLNITKISIGAYYYDHEKYTKQAEIREVKSGNRGSPKTYNIFGTSNRITEQ